jgi:hypothetical protein
MGYLGTNDLETEALCNTFRMSTMQRIDEILQMIDKSVDFGLRTAVWNLKGGKLLHEFNRVIRDFTFYDFHPDAWSTVILYILREREKKCSGDNSQIL